MERTEQNKQQTLTVSFAALEPSIERTILTPEERTYPGRDWVSWGTRNSFPAYLVDLVDNVATLRTIVLGLADYVLGNGATVTFGPFAGGKVNRKGLTVRKLVLDAAESLGTFGGFAWELIPSNNGELLELYPLKLQHLRTNKEQDVFYYSEKWGDTRTQPLVRGRWTGSFARDKEGAFKPAVLYVQQWGEGVYPVPLYAAALKACETERGIDEFHLGNIERGFMGSYIINFNNGAPATDEIKREIERDFTRKFSGSGNAGRVMFCWNDSKDVATTLQKMEVSDYADKYNTLAKNCERRIFTSFRANPNLFGIPTESNGFNSEEYESAFKLFNRTIVAPLQDAIVEAWGEATGGELTITPFTLDGADTAAATGAQGENIE